MVSDGDVYVAGNEAGGFDANGNPLPSIAEYWKNGSRVVLASSTSSPTVNSIFVSGSNVYAVGSVDRQTETSPNNYFGGSIATLWINGVPTALTDSLHISMAESVFVSGSDVYVAGYAAQTSQGFDYQAVYWKNGNPVTLPATPNHTSYANSIFISGNDVYVSGGDSLNTAEYWKNGTLIPLLGSEAYQLVVYGSDVYIAGYNYPLYGIGTGVQPGNVQREVTDYNYSGATFWKNGEPSPLTPNAPGYATANSIAVVAP